MEVAQVNVHMAASSVKGLEVTCSFGSMLQTHTAGGKGGRAATQAAWSYQYCQN
jgi:hypothetical protein